MKKLISTIIAVGIIFAIFTACDSSTQDEKAIIPPTKYTTEGKTNELVPDETMTGELVISDYIWGEGNEFYNVAVKMYNELYPNVKVNLDLTLSDDMDINDYADKIATEIMSGKGPDVFLVTGDFQDPYKMMKSGALADLTTYFENDQAFDVSKYNENILYGGQFQGKQYAIPTGYDFLSLYGETDSLNELGFDSDKCNDYYSTLEEILRVSKENEITISSSRDDFGRLSEIYNGLDIFDYTNNTVNLNNDVLKQNFEITKEFNDTVYKKTNSQLGDLDIEYSSVNNIGYLGQSKGVLNDTELTMIPLKNAKGDITARPTNLYAVSSNSENIQNSYNFLKLILHPDFLNVVHSGDNNRVRDIPLSYEFIQNEFDGSFEKGNKHTDKLEADFFNIIKTANELNLYANPDTVLLYEIMPQYFNDEKTLDECLQEAQSRLEIYISE